MNGTICLQGGAEFGNRCVDMDAALLDRSPAGDVVILAGAAAAGREYEMASRNAATYYSRLTDRTVVAADDPRTDSATSFLNAVESAAFVVLPGGSPRMLLDVLIGAVRDALVGVASRGGTISGASAGAMVLCAFTALPGDGVTHGLGLVPGLAIPHFDGSNWWDLDVGEDVPRWGLPECGGVVFHGDSVTAVGAPGAQRLDRSGASLIERSAH